jgi:hypothetical protein
MNWVKLIRGIGIVLVLVLLMAAFALWLKPPDILRVGANYAAKIVCSNVFLAARDPQQVLQADVQAPGIPLLRLMSVSVDRERRVVRAGLLGFIGGGLAVARPGTGCAVVPDGNLEFAVHVGSGPAPPDPHAGTAVAAPVPTAPVPPASAPAGADTGTGRGRDAGADWPEGDTVITAAALNQLLADDTLAGPGVRAIVVVDHGRIVAERYAAGFAATTPLLGWSMTKSVMAGLVGLLVKEGRLALNQPAGWSAPDGGREHIRIADLLAMSSGLSFNEAMARCRMSPACSICNPTWRGMRASSPWCIPRASSGATRAAAPTSCHASCKTRRVRSPRAIRPKNCSSRSA